MKTVFAKHEDTKYAKEYLFRVPKHIKKINEGELLAVHTMKGLSLAIATTEMQECSELIAEKLGAYLPLKEVYCIVTYELFQLIKNADEKDFGDFGTIPF
jgi:hypothetical protein